MDNKLLGAALQWGAVLPIFPCQPNLKFPATPHGFHDATQDEDKIVQWWTEEPMRNIAACPDHGGYYVVDADGTEGIDTLRTWFSQHGKPKTLFVRTPSGGVHVWFKGKRPSSVRIAPGIDTRGEGGYVLLPPSIVNGREYVFLTHFDL